MNQSAFFKMLGAPLKNVRWSWGAVRQKDNAVFLKVWTDHVRTENSIAYVQVTFHARFRDRPTRPGNLERIAQVDGIRHGAPCYLVMCEAEDVKARPRRMKSFHQENVIPGGRVTEMNGESWIEMLPAIPISGVMPNEGV